ncbi:CHRD domain-containing protein [Polaromonas sp.]|uniref:CHRD domain-containing protein n=1 Tax=Polaromonas sp. TaxID=1869339 RepID=UPI003752E542
MANFPRIIRAALAASAVVLVVAGCGMMQKTSPMVALTTQLRGANEVPPVASAATGQVDAMFNKETNVLRWELKYDNLSGPATAGHFHGPALVGANAGVALGWASPVSSPMIGQATLTPAQAADLLAGRWYANIHTAKFPGGEIRGQMTVRP